MTTETAPKVLFIDDNPTHREIMQLYFSSLGWDVATAEDGYAGLDHLTQDEFDVVITDMRMPRLSGLEMVRQWRTRRACDKSPPVLLISSHVTLEMRQEARELGIRECLERPLSLDTFARHLLENILD